MKMNFVKDRKDAELMKEIQGRMIEINDYVQNPDRDTFVPLLGDELRERYGNERVLAMADGALWGENDIIEEASEKFTKLFGTFNKRYFDGKLPAYKVIVRLVHRYGVPTIWPAGRSITLLAGLEAFMVTELLDKMAKIAANDFSDSSAAEIDRLCKLGAPIQVFRGGEWLSAEEFIAAISELLAATSES